MTEVHALIRNAFIEASKLVHVIPKRGMALLLEAMATGSVVVQDTKAFNILQEAKAHQSIYEEIKTQENKMCAIDLQIETVCYQIGNIQYFMIMNAVPK